MTAVKGSAGSRDAPSAVPGREPPASRPAAREHVLRRLSPAECFELLEPDGVGRVGFTAADRIMILPVNFAVTAAAILTPASTTAGSATTASCATTSASSRPPATRPLSNLPHELKAPVPGSASLRRVLPRPRSLRFPDLTGADGVPGRWSVRAGTWVPVG